MAQATQLSWEQGVSLPYLLAGQGLELVREAGEVRVRHQATGDLFTSEEVPVDPAALTAARHPGVQYGCIELRDGAAGPAAARLAQLAPGLAEAGLLLGQVIAAPDGTARLDYCFPVPQPQLATITWQLNVLQYREGAQLREAPHPLYAPPGAAVGEAVPAARWAERDGQFNQARLVVTGSGPAHAAAQTERIREELVRLGATVSAATPAGPGELELRVTYHTRSPRIWELSAVLEGAAQITGVTLRESESQRFARLTGVREREESKLKVLGFEQGY